MADIHTLSDIETVINRIASRITEFKDYGLVINDIPTHLGYTKLEWSRVILVDLTLGQLRDVAGALFVTPEWLLTGAPSPDPIDPIVLRRTYCRCIDLMHLSDPGCPIHGRTPSTRAPHRLDTGSTWAIQIEAHLSRRLSELGVHEHDLADAYDIDARTWGELKISRNDYGHDDAVVGDFLAALDLIRPTKETPR